MASRTSSQSTPRRFHDAVEAMMRMSWRPELTIEEVPAPSRIAPYAVAISAEVTSVGDDLGSGRLVLLHEPGGNPSWNGDFRCVSYARAEVDAQMANDPMLNEVGWTWLEDALRGQNAAFDAASGTVTSVSSRSFGGMEDEPPRAEVEIRASWTPLIDEGAEIVDHLRAWSDLLCFTAGLPPLPEGVVMLPSLRSSSRRR